MRSNIYSKFISVILILVLLLCANPTPASAYESVSGESQTENRASMDDNAGTAVSEEESMGAIENSAKMDDNAGTAASEEESAEATESENPIDSSEAKQSADAIYDPQPSTLEEVQAVIDTYQAEYQATLEAKGFMAALKVQKPHWQYAITEELMPEGYNCQLVDWDETFGREYYTFFPNPAMMATYTINAGASTTTIQSVINAASSNDTIVFNGNVTLTAALTVNKSLTFKAASGTVTITSANNARHILVAENMGNITLTFDNVKLQGNAATITDNLSVETNIGGIKVSPGNNLTVVGAEIYNCKSNYFGGAIDSQSNLILTNCDIHDNYNPTRQGYSNNAGGGGVAIRSYDGTISGLELTVSSTKIRNNTTLISGGGIILAADDTVVKIENNSEITNNTADGGGGIYAYYGGAKILIKNSKVNGNASQSWSGGGVYMLSINNTLEIENSEIANNSANSAGGGIYLDNGQVQNNHVYLKAPQATTIKVSNSNITGNTAGGSGAGIYVNGNRKIHENYQTSAGNALPAELILSGVTISGNTANNNGGGVYLSGSNLTADGGTLISNNDATNGGGVYAASVQYTGLYSFSGTGTLISGTDSTFIKQIASTFTLTDGTVEKNTATANGGGVYLSGLGNPCLAEFDMKSNAVVKECVAAKGGGVYVKDGGSLSMENNADIEQCKAKYTTNGSGRGGGVFVDGGTLTMTDTAVIQECCANVFGGGVYFEGAGGKMEMNNNSAVKNNETDLPNVSGLSGSHGGGIYFGRNAELTMNDQAQVSGNKVAGAASGTVYYGGGIYIASDTCKATMKNNTVVSGNTAYNAGGVFTQGEFIMSDYARIEDCTAVGGTTGGGIACGFRGSVLLEDSVIIQRNSAPNNGGGVAINGGMLTMTGGIIRGNKSGNGGGGVYVSRDSDNHIGGQFYMSGGLIDDNTASAYGGGVFVTGVLAEEGIFKMTGGTVSNNKAGSRGGGVYLSTYSFFTLNEDDNTSKITANEVTVGTGTGEGDGGGVYVRQNSNFTMSAGTIDKNMASRNGSGVYLYAATAEFQMSGGTIGGSGNANTAGSHGGGVYASIANVTMSGTAAITYNEADNSGGGVYMGNGTWTMVAGTISGNTAKLNGGGVYMSNSAGTFTMESGDISGNDAKGTGGANGGGGAYINAGTFKVNNGTISNNTANKDGGGIYTMVNGIVNVAKATISGNTAAGDGGGIYTAAADYVAGGGANAYANLSVASSVTFGGNTANKAYIPLDATKTPYSSYWTTIQNSSYSSGVTVPVVSRLASVNNYDINASFVLVEFNVNGGDYYINGSVDTIPNQNHAWDALVTDPKSVANSEMYRKDYEFVGWTLAGSSTVWDFSSDKTTATADAADGTSDGIIHLVAKWKEIKGSITINKYKDDGTSALAGVTFTLKDHTGTVIGTATTGGSGIATFTDLSVGTYTITETKTPEGYSLLAESFKATIPTDVTGTSYAGVTRQTTPDGTKTFGYDLTYKVTNQAAFMLPEAGATGTWNQYSLWIGLALLLAGGGSAAWRRKRRGMRGVV